MYHLKSRHAACLQELLMEVRPGDVRCCHASTRDALQHICSFQSCIIECPEGVLVWTSGTSIASGDHRGLTSERPSACSWTFSGWEKASIDQSSLDHCTELPIHDSSSGAAVPGLIRQSHRQAQTALQKRRAARSMHKDTSFRLLRYL